MLLLAVQMPGMSLEPNAFLPTHSQFFSLGKRKRTATPPPLPQQVSRRPKNRSARCHQKSLANLNRKAEESTAPLVSSYSISASGWLGIFLNSTPKGQQLISEWEDYSILRRLVSFTRVPYRK
jgi:hypothetical protein